MRLATFAATFAMVAGCTIQDAPPPQYPQQQYQQQPPPDQSQYPSPDQSSSVPPPTSVPPSENYPRPSQPQPYPTPAQPQPGFQPSNFDARGWVNLGTQSITGRDRDFFDVRGDTYLSGLALVVDDGDVNLREAYVTFADGQVWEPGIRQVFRDGARYRVIDLGTPRGVRRVELRYGRVGAGQPRLALYGRPAAAPQPAPQPYPQPQQPQPAQWDSRGWTRLEASYLPTERGNSAINSRGDVYINGITFVVENGDADLSDVVVTFGDGRTFNTGIRQSFRDGVRVRAIDWGGDPRQLRRVDFRTNGGSGRPALQVWGRVTSPPIVAPQPQPQPQPEQPQPAQWDARGWTRLEAVYLNPSVQNGAVNSRGEVYVNAITFVVEAGDADISDMVITFGNGQTFNGGFRQAFRNGQRFRTVEWGGDPRTLKRVDFRVNGGSGRPAFQIWGRTASPPIANPNPNPSTPGWDSRGYRLLAEATLPSNKTAARLTFPDDQKPMTKLVIVVTGGEFRMHTTYLMYKNRDGGSLSIDQVFHDGERKELDLRSLAGRALDSLSFQYPGTSVKGAPRVQIWGLEK